MIVWLGISDEHGYYRANHRLRLYLRDKYGVRLIGPGYSWDISNPKTDIGEKDFSGAKWFVWDDRGNELLNVRFDAIPSCRRAWVEQDYHQKCRWALPLKFDPEVIFGCVLRPQPVGDPWVQPQQHPKYDPWIARKGWRLSPYVADTGTFFPDERERTITLGLYGNTNPWYPSRRSVKVLMLDAMKNRKDIWCANPAGYWRVSSKSSDGHFYDDKLAEKLRSVKCLWVDGSNRNIFLAKYHEGIASGCLLIGERPFGWKSYYPDEFLIDATPETAIAVADEWASKDKERTEITRAAREHCVRYHGIEARADQFMEALHD